LGRTLSEAGATGRPPGGESFAEQITRVAAAIDDLPGGNVVLVVHAGTIRAALALALELAPNTALRFVIDPLSVTRIDRLAGGWRIGAINR
jgi:alpha-ribazole phosphatase